MVEGHFLTTPKQIERRERIEKAAYEVLEETGYKGASLLLIAKRASVSNETLYRWYGNKQALFRTLVEANAREAKALLELEVAKGSDPLATLASLGPILLNLVTGERAIMLNRAAASDVSDTGSLGQTIAEAGRETIAPLVKRILDQAGLSREIQCDDTTEATETYFNLLIGDLQIRHVIGVSAALSKTEINERSKRAMRQFLEIYDAAENSKLNP
jgi:AcrR family transcriptional regulator